MFILNLLRYSSMTLIQFKIITVERRQFSIDNRTYERRKNRCDGYAHTRERSHTHTTLFETIHSNQAYGKFYNLNNKKTNDIRYSNTSLKCCFAFFCFILARHTPSDEIIFRHIRIELYNSFLDKTSLNLCSLKICMVCLLAKNSAILGVRVIKKTCIYLCCWHSWHTEKQKRKIIFLSIKIESK